MNGHIRKRDWFGPSVPENRRIGNHLVLMGKNEYWTAGSEPFLADTTTAIFLRKGSMEVSINMVDYEITAPTMIVYMEGMIVSQKSVSSDADMDVIILSRELTDDILSSAVYAKLRARILKAPVFPLYGLEKVTFAFNYLLVNMVAMKDAPYRLEAARHIALTLFYGFVLREADSAPETKGLRSDGIADRFFQMVRENYRTERTVSFYADKLCITPKYLSQAVKDATGKPALEWIDDYVCAEAKALLRSTDMSIDQIGDDLGFANQSLFGKYFKRVIGLSPRQYRKQVC